MSESEAASSPSTTKPNETVHQMKMRHQNELKALSKGGNGQKKLSGKELKAKEAELSSKHEQEMKDLQTAWNNYRIVESGGSVPSSSTDAKTPLADKSSPPLDDLLSGPAYEERTVKVSQSQRKKMNREAREEEERKKAVELAKQRPDLRAIEDKKIAEQINKMDFSSSDLYKSAISASINTNVTNGRTSNNPDGNISKQNMGDDDGSRLVLKQIKPDGHCLYRAIESQLRQHADDTKAPTWQEIRNIAADYIAANQDEFTPFLVNEDGDPMTQDEFDKYVANIRNDGSTGRPVIWGGHVEVVALASALRRPITIISADGTPELVNPAPAKDANNSSKGLYITYHKHALATGEHYNCLELQ